MTDEVFSSVTGSHHVSWVAMILETVDGTMAGSPVGYYGIPFVVSDKRHRLGSNMSWKLGADWKKQKHYEMGQRTFYTVIRTALDVNPSITFKPCGDGFFNLLAMALGITAVTESPAAKPSVSATLIGCVSDGSYTHYIIQTGLLVNRISASFNYTDSPDVTVDFVGQWNEFDANGVISEFISKTFPVTALADMTATPLGPKDMILEYSTDDPSATDLPAFTKWPTVSKVVLNINNNFKKEPGCVQGADTTYQPVAARHVPGELVIELSTTDRQYQNTHATVLPDRNMYDYLANNSLARVKLSIGSSPTKIIRLGRYWTGAAAAGNPSYWLDPPDHHFKFNEPELERTHLLGVSTLRATLGAGTLWS